MKKTIISLMVALLVSNNLMAFDDIQDKGYGHTIGRLYKIAAISAVALCVLSADNADAYGAPNCECTCKIPAGQSDSYVSSYKVNLFTMDAPINSGLYQRAKTWNEASCFEKCVYACSKPSTGANLSGF